MWLYVAPQEHKRYAQSGPLKVSYLALIFLMLHCTLVVQQVKLKKRPDLTLSLDILAPLAVLLVEPKILLQ